MIDGMIQNLKIFGKWKTWKQTRMREINAASRDRIATATNFVSYFREIFKHYFPACTWELRKEQTFAVAFLGSSPVKRIYTLRFGYTFRRSSQLHFPLEQLSSSASLYSLVQHSEKKKKLADIDTAWSSWTKLIIMWQMLLKKNIFFRLWQGQRKISLHSIPLTIFPEESENSNYKIALLPPCVCSKTEKRKNENDVSSLYILCGLNDVQNMRDK